LSQTPAAQASSLVQALPSSHAAAASVKAQSPVAGSQASVVQTLPSSQTLAAPRVQTPALHWSPAVQAEPSASQG
jgi:hypothetical protein